ncbi:ATP-binding protein [Methylotuvimicrobium alcaliphilum]|uniref:histidine kinase n=1 Tax=Methylotuvimicrobium alcaliphilum (strain DSM 19304 / NCIMB 14124 / VKM B-2133 / 20Z) TaxID=1091494 RepID=G4SVN1_META2|nr:ATP-binding protein [Methylotuvimicrobium alcaliphilum]CCE24090.1 Integral membrane sensor signal transduction histidine kinase [Methylotuvimicrobium alcaliphilum 20Z]
MNSKSLSFRLLVSAGVVLASFFILVAIVLEQGYRESAEQTLRENLKIQVYSLLSAAELTRAGQIKMPKELREPRFSNPGSGLYAWIQPVDADVVWFSPSAIGLNASSAPDMDSGQFVFLLDEQGRYVLHYKVIWENDRGKERKYVFSVAEESLFVAKQVDRFKTALGSWLLAMGLILILIQFLVLRWGLSPLRLIVRDLESIERGEKSLLDGSYVTELRGLAGNLNALISSERAHLERYRNTLADLAHSLKTPLAILRGSIDSLVLDKKTVHDQISRMDEIVEYQLQRAAAKGEKKITGTMDAAMGIDKIIASMKKVHADKPIVFEIKKPDKFKIYCEQGDFYEIAGNLIDNACKWCDKKVKVSILNKNQIKQDGFSFLLQIEDDGPGIPIDHLNDILKRGVRADQNTDGHGIGMAVVNEIIDLLGGQLLGDKSQSLGGMRWRVYLP